MVRSNPLNLDSSVSRPQLVIFSVCWLLVLFEGFDTLAIAYTAPSIVAEWALPYETLGTLLSAGVVGMIIGGLTVAPYKISSKCIQ